MSETINNKPVRAWEIGVRFRVNELAEKEGTSYRNITGFNSDPALQLGDWTQDVSGGTGSSGGAVIKEPQKTNPDAADVIAGFLTFLLSSNNSIAFVSVNGSVLDAPEYNLAGDTITVTPNGGFAATSDEVLVFQNEFNGASGVKGNYIKKTAVYVMSFQDYIVECNGTFDVTLPIPDGTDAGKHTSERGKCR